ncbi:MAG: hypothetical protein NTY74_14370 [Ignavibacteriae bacterium]|nr:hypothetical protein [Ignavibacteriota bacterium]
MKFTLSILLWVFCFLNFVNADSLSTKEDTIKNFIPKIKVIGHSWAVGTFKGKEDYFKKQGIIIDETSEVGTSLTWAYERLIDVPENKYDALCILTGINDYKNDLGKVTEVFSNILELGVSKAPVIFVFNIGYYEPAVEMVAFMNDWLNEVAKLNPNLIIVIDIYGEIESKKKDGFKMSSNGLHPSSYDIIQKLFVSVVKDHYNLK